MALQLFRDTELHAELRITAAVVLFESKPSLGLVNVLAATLLKEPSMQVASFVYTYMKALARSTAPDMISV